VSGAGPEEIEELERRFMDAVRDRDVDTLERMLGERFTLTTGRPGAEVRGRAEWLEVTRGAYVIESYDFEWLEVDRYGDAAVARSRYRQRGRMGDDDRTQPFLMTDVWVRLEDEWRLVSRHITPLES
jgi:ketosteroid isomerase-like protein